MHRDLLTQGKIVVFEEKCMKKSQIFDEVKKSKNKSDCRYKENVIAFINYIIYVTLIIIIMYISVLKH